MSLAPDFRNHYWRRVDGDFQNPKVPPPGGGIRRTRIKHRPISTGQRSTLATHHVIPRDDLSGFGTDILLFQSVARFPVDPIEAPFSLSEEAG
jgi:hypothetical protein